MTEVRIWVTRSAVFGSAGRVVGITVKVAASPALLIEGGETSWTPSGVARASLARWQAGVGATRQTRRATRPRTRTRTLSLATLGGEGGLGPEVGPDRRLELGGLPAEDRLLGEQLRLLLLELALLGLELRLLPLQRRLPGLERVGLGGQLLLLALQVGLVGLGLVVLVLVGLAGMRRRAELGRRHQGPVVAGPVLGGHEVEGLPFGGGLRGRADVLLAEVQREHGDDQRDQEGQGDQPAGQRVTGDGRRPPAPEGRRPRLRPGAEEAGSLAPNRCLPASDRTAGRSVMAASTAVNTATVLA
jgi:hypothetical protein